ncbi:RNase adapter RapZ [Shimia thalassica]|uniref:RNase adapter RapZ n=1 Tax=Shimia thalassica TaxID=1715693 RepID=UPI001C0A26F0|nr:RNase adapter RapZ [Shimia thalassica]MBU2941379.1 RNase adapter RapZ [Shimia thalassica]MDO6503136.1 RNase adapter RapZ [Shimia thalassica]
MPENASKVQRLVLVTGPSGAGRSTAIKALEDAGYETIDNLPLGLLESLMTVPRLSRPLALGVDVRNRDFSQSALISAMDMLHRTPGIAPELLYLDCQPQVLQRRYSETRRRHPLAPAESPMEGIQRELDLLEPIKAQADILIDTSELSPHALRAEIERWFVSEGAPRLALTIQSFSYKRGLPMGVDTVFDCRFLRNPYWEPSLRKLNGIDPRVGAYVGSDERFAPFVTKLHEMLDMLLPAYVAEGRAHFSIGFGCTGGQHRSVFATETLAQGLATRGWQVSIRHRELDLQAERATRSRFAASDKDGQI